MRNVLFIALLALCAFVSLALADDQPITPFNWTTIDIPANSFGNYLYFDTAANTREITVDMKKVQADESDPDLYVRAGVAPTRGDYDGADTTTNTVHTVTLVRETTATNRYYIGVYGFNARPTRVEVYVKIYDCVNANCGNNANPAISTGTCNSESGVCQCIPSWSAFPDCSASTTDSAFEVVKEGAVLAGKQVFYKYNAPVPPLHGYMTVTVNRQKTSGMMIVMIARGRTPTTRDNDGFVYAYSSVSSASINIDANAYVEGEWIVGIIAPTKYDTAFSISNHYYNCENDCSGHGLCDAPKGTCTCDAGYTTVEDCSIHSAAIDYKFAQEVVMTPYSSRHFYVNVSTYFSHAPVEMTIALDAIDVPATVTSFPMMYLKFETIPSDKNYDVASKKPTAAIQQLHVPASKLHEGQYHLLVTNPNSHNYTYSLALKYVPHCTHGCSDHGRCNEAAECVCDAGFIGGDCSISKSMCADIMGIETGVETAVVVFLVFFFAVVGFAGAVLVYKKFVLPPATAAAPELQYDQLNA